MIIKIITITSIGLITHSLCDVNYVTKGIQITFLILGIIGACLVGYLTN